MRSRSRTPKSAAAVAGLPTAIHDDEQHSPAYIGTDETFRDALEEFAQVYADQAEQDYGQLKQAIADGETPIQAGV
jgi:hypothetical protein